jgi:hypothetical protein
MTRTLALRMGIAALLVGGCVAGGAMAQQSAAPAAQGAPAVPAKPAAPVDDIDPGVNTSAAAAPSAASAPAAAPAAASPGPGANRQTRPATPATATRPATGRAQDRVDLDATQITGNRELPRVLYIVPWKRSDLGDLAGKPVNSLLDEVLAPVDRDVFRRETRYFDAVSAAPAGTGMRDGSQAPESGGQ